MGNHIGATRRGLLKGASAALAAPFLARAASAQPAWPTRAVRVIIPYPPAGGADTTGRIFFSKLSETLGQQFAIDNRKRLMDFIRQRVDDTDDADDQDDDDDEETGESVSQQVSFESSPREMIPHSISF